MTFSKSLADYLARKTGSEVRRLTFQLGRVLGPGEESSTGLYAIVKASSGWPLRVTLERQLAEHWRHPTRYIAECLPV